MSGKKKRVGGRVKRQFADTATDVPPGTISVDPNAPKPVVTVIAYGPEDVKEEQVTDIESLAAYFEKWPVTWVNVDGLGEEETLVKLGHVCKLHRLALEDVVNVYQRPKTEHYDEHEFVVVRMPAMTGRFETEQVSLFLSRKFVITFQEKQGDVFDEVRKRIREGRGRIRTTGPDYLAYALLDAVVDGYFPVLEEYGERIDAMEDEVAGHPQKGLIGRVHAMKRDLLALRRAVWPLREAVNSLMRDETPFITKDARLYLRDCYDHTMQIIDMIENYRELAAGLVETYMSYVSNRMNEVMKVLSIIATIFLPLSFIAGLYGMNFNVEKSAWNMPELNWAFGYPFVLSVMCATVLGMLFFFKRKGWLGRSEIDGGDEDEDDRR